MLAKLLVGLLPVLLFLTALIWMDSYKLVRLRVVLGAIALGGLAAALSYTLNVPLIPRAGLGLDIYSRYVAPPIEEIAKGLVVAILIRSNRVGFLVDAAIFGFAVGAGFALIENLYYLNVLADSHLAVWIVRGFGTAVMHGGATSIFAMISKTLADEHPGLRVAVFVPGWLVAVVLHSFFNHFLVSPVLMTAGVLAVLPPLVALVFHRSEQSLREWLDMGFDADTELLRLIHSGGFSDSRIGRYLASLKDRFRGDVVADLLCYLRLHTELSLRAKGLLMMRESGFRVSIDDEVRGQLAEMEYLQRSIGATGRLALHPFLRTSSKDLWQTYMLRA